MHLVYQVIAIKTCGKVNILQNLIYGAYKQDRKLIFKTSDTILFRKRMED